jgi:hypothetical protein
MTRNCVAASLILLLGVALPSRAMAQVAAVSQPTVSFTKEFPGSEPAYYSISLRQDGEALYRTAPEEKPAEFRLSAESTQPIFSLAQKLSLFREIEVESGRKVAQMGKKTFGYQDGAEATEVSFNHTENPDAVALLALFERLSATMRHRDRLEYLVRFDRLGVVKELLQIEVDLDQGRLLEAALLAPLLEKVRTNKALVNVAQERAGKILAKLPTASP